MPGMMGGPGQMPPGMSPNMMLNPAMANMAMMGRGGVLPLLSLHPPLQRESSLLKTYWSESYHRDNWVDRPRATGVWISFSR
jgi:hypothetical protein